MSRQKKIKTIHLEQHKIEVPMTEEKALESTVNEELTLDSLETEIDLARSELEKTKIQIEEKRRELESFAHREVSKEEVSIVEKQIMTRSERKAAEIIIEKNKAYDNVKITGRFMNMRNPGQAVKLPYIKYPEDPVKWYPFEHNKVYTIPRGFAEQINEHYHTPRFVQKEGIMDANAPSSQVDHIDTSNKKFAFVPMKF